MFRDCRFYLDFAIRTRNTWVIAGKVASKSHVRHIKRSAQKKGWDYEHNNRIF
jgi:hypothetical protein